MNKSKSAPEQNEGQREFSRIECKYRRKLAQFLGKELIPGSPEDKKYEKIIQKRFLEFQNWQMKYCLSKPEYPVDTPEGLSKWVKHVLNGFEVAKWMAKGAGVVSIFNIQEKYYEARDYILELYEKNRTLPRPPTIESNPRTGFETIRDWYIAVQEQAKQTAENIDGKAEETKGTISSEKKPWYKLKTLWFVVVGVLSLITYLLNISDSGTFRSIISHFNQQFSHSQSAFDPNAQTDSNAIIQPSKPNHDTSKSLPDSNLSSPESPNQ